MNNGDITQFHVRDAGSARDALEMLLTPQAFESTAAGALLFTCTGRGHRFFREPDVDISITATALGEAVPMVGLFCAGEFRPIGNENLFTATRQVSLSFARNQRKPYLTETPPSHDGYPRTR